MTTAATPMDNSGATPRGADAAAAPGRRNQDTGGSFAALVAVALIAQVPPQRQDLPGAGPAREKADRQARALNPASAREKPTELQERATVDISRMAAEELKQESPKDPSPARPGRPAPEGQAARFPARAGGVPSPAPARPQAKGPAQSDLPKTAPVNAGQVLAPPMTRQTPLSATANKSAPGIQAISPPRAAGAVGAAPGFSSPRASSTGAITLRAVAGAANAHRLSAPRGGKSLSNSPAAGRQPARPALEAQALRGMLAAVKKNGGTLVMRLDPDHMGRLRVRIEIHEQRVTATLDAGSEPARRLLEETRDTLRAALEARGLSVERVEVRHDPGLAPPQGAHDPGREGVAGDAGGGAAQPHTPRDGGARDGGESLTDGRTEAPRRSAEPAPFASYASEDSGVLTLGLDALA